MKLDNITETLTKYPVKNLKWNPVDNIIVGQVKCDYGNPNLYEGYITVQWKKNGTPTNRYKGCDDLKLNIPNETAENTL